MPKHTTRRRPALLAITHIAVLLALIAVVAALTVRGFDRVEPVQVSASESQPGGFFGATPTLLVIGDSMAGGVGDPSILKNYPQILADNMGWNLALDAVGGRGFLETDLRNTGLDRIVPPFINDLQYDVQTYRADYILVDGGRNDLGKPPDLVAPAIDEYYTQLRKDFPDAKIVAMVPSYISPEGAGVNYAAIAEAIRSSAEKIGAPVLDPIAEGWYEDVDLEPLLWRDGVHLNAVGADFYAEKVTEGMQRLGIAGNTNSGQGAN